MKNMEDSNEDELDRLAREELMKEAKRGAERAREVGAFGWVKPSGTSTNKKFLGNVLVSTLRANERKRKKSDDDVDHGSRKHKKRSHSDEHVRYHKSQSKSYRSPKLINDGYFRYNDHSKHFIESENKERKKYKNKHSHDSDHMEKEKDKNHSESDLKERECTENRKEKDKHHSESDLKEREGTENRKEKDKHHSESDLKEKERTENRKEKDKHHNESDRKEKENTENRKEKDKQHNESELKEKENTENKNNQKEFSDKNNERLKNKIKEHKKKKASKIKHKHEENNNKVKNSEESRICEGDNSDGELIAETVYYDDIIKIHRKKSSKNEEESLIEDIEKDKHLEKEESPKEKIIEFVGDYLIEKRQKKKSKHKSGKSHKSKHKHKKHHKHKMKKSS